MNYLQRFGQGLQKPTRDSAKLQGRRSEQPLAPQGEGMAALRGLFGRNRSTGYECAAKPG